MTESTPVDAHPRITFERLPDAARNASLADMVEEGFGRSPKMLSPFLLYDERGSALFERICQLDAYYPTRTERALLERHAGDIARHVGSEVTVAELGSGSSEKTAIVLQRLLADRDKLLYVPVDISESALSDAAERLTSDLPKLEIHAIAAEYFDGVRRLEETFAGPHLTLFLGSNIGNFDPAEAHDFLRELRAAMGPQDYLLLGVDLVKDVGVLERAYDDEEGVTAEFNKNGLRHLNAALDADFDVDAFEHRAVFVPDKSRIEMHLVSTRAQTVTIGELDRRYAFEAGEHIHTESSHKYTEAALDALFAETGWRLAERFLDDRRYFSLNLLRPEVPA